MNNGINLINFTEKPTLLLSNISFKHCQWKLDKHTIYLWELSLVDARHNLFFIFLVKDKVFRMILIFTTKTAGFVVPFKRI